jgi:HEAT repeat protein
MLNTRSMAILAMFLAVATGFVAAADPVQPKPEPVPPAQLVETLKSNAAAAEKAAACKQLAIYGNQDAVPALAALLADKELSSWARIALEAIPGPQVDNALCDALGKVQGRLLLGVINSLGTRRAAVAVDPLIKRLQDADADVASASAVALGQIAGPAAAKALEQALASAPAAVKSAVAEGCILCAERLVAEGKAPEAIKLYAVVEQAPVPKQRVLEAVRGTIVAQGSAGVPRLVELLESSEKARFALGLRVARELSGQEVADALLAQLAKAKPERQAALIVTLADRGDAKALPAIMQLAKAGAEPARCMAIRALKRLGNASCVPVLLDAALDANEGVAQAALTVLADLPGADVDTDLAGRLVKADGKLRQVLIDLAGQRPIVAAVPALLKAADDSDAAIRAAALAALGSTIEFGDLEVLVKRVAGAQSADDADAAEKALRDACQRMPDRDACAEKLVAAMAGAASPVKCRFLEILSSMGGAKALAAMGAAVKDADPEIQETGSRLLGSWMDVDVAPVLLDLAQNSTDPKYQIRALRGYIRVVRQFTIPDPERAKMCRAALGIAQRTAEKKLILEVMGRYPSADMLSLAMETTKTPELKAQAVAVAMLIAQKTGGQSKELQKALAEMGTGLVKIEIVKAEYGAGTNVKDVTTILRKHVHDFPVIVLPSPSYNATFGGDPAPGMVKQLKVVYRMAGKPGEVSFQENASIQLPKPK